MYLPFDQFQRYKTFSAFIEKYKNDKKIDTLKVLEIGANCQKNLGKFLTNDEIFYSDLEIPEEFQGDDHFLKLNACDMQEVADDYFDIVIASDVYEHIPQILRKDFVQEINRVAKYFSIISFPYASSHNEAIETEVNDYYKYFAGTDYLWLKEHIENGLPSCESLNNILDDNHISYYAFCHGDVRLWAELTKLHFYCTVYADLIEYRKHVDRYYNEHIYYNDVSDKSYRIFYVMSSAEQDNIEAICGNMFGQGTSKDNLRYIRERIDEIHSLAEMKLSIKNNQDIQRNNQDIQRNNQDIQRNNRNIQKNVLNESGVGVYNLTALPINCYFDFGNGFSEETRQYIEPSYANYLEVAIPEHACMVRINLCEDCYSYLKDFAIYDENGGMVEYITNGVCCNDYIVFDTCGPWVQIEKGSSNKIMVRGTICKCANVEMMNIFKNYRGYKSYYERNKVFLYENKEYSLERASIENLLHSQKGYNLYLEDALEKKDEQICELQQRIARQNYETDVFYHSLEWKMVKPMYKMLKGIKNLRICQLAYSFHVTRKQIGYKRAIGMSMDYLKCIRKKEKFVSVPETINYNVFVISKQENNNKLDTCIQSLQEQSYQKTGIKVICEYSKEMSQYKNVDVIHTDNIDREIKKMLTALDGDYVVLCYDDVRFDKDAFKIMTAMLQEHPADIVYADENLGGKAYYKPDYSPDLALSNFYLGEMLVFNSNLIQNNIGDEQIVGDYLFSYFFDCIKSVNEIMHIPVLLYQSEGNMEIDLEARKDIIQKIVGNEVIISQNRSFFDIQYSSLKSEPKVSIIIPTKDKSDLTNDCVQSILEKSTYSNYEVLILDNRSEEKETFEWFDAIQKQDERVRVYKADFEFNWSKLNNYGISKSTGDVYVFLNNDTLIISNDWLERLSNHALRDNVGVVGPLLLYDDDTIQHAGVVVGIGGWADHIYKALPIDQYDGVFVSPFATRNVTAVTGACMAISKKTIDEIGLFDDEFIICGSDVEICLRAYEHGLDNIYDAFTRLYHLESKSRDSYIPEIDFKKSYDAYGTYREYGDPFYNMNLDLNNPVPTQGDEKMRLDWILDKLRNNRFAIKVYRHMLDAVSQKNVVSFIAEVQEMKTRPVDGIDTMRINLLVPSVDNRYVFGGISTAHKFFEQFCEMKGIQKRIIVTDDQIDERTMIDLPGYQIVSPEDDIIEGNQIVGMGNRANRTLPVMKNDIFLATSWWSAYIAFEMLRWQADYYRQDIKKLMYFVQDYEPGFYPWSSRYLMADSTYKSDVPTIAIYNSSILKDYFKKNGYTFANEYYFDPTLNGELKKVLLKYKDSLPRKKQILLYGRPSVQRNAFELIVDSLKIWCEMQEDIDEWRILSAGEVFDDIELKNGKKIEVLGKLSLEEYAKTMLETKAAISLMVSPHPSYPPLEMSTFGIKVITNTYDNKNLNGFNENIVALSNCSGQAIANKLYEICSDEKTNHRVVLEGDYVNNETVWDNIIDSVYKDMM